MSAPDAAPPDPTGPACPRCGARGIDVNPFSITTAIGISEFYDDDGRRHVHDPNVTTTGHRCRSCDHAWSVTSKAPCWCERP